MNMKARVPVKPRFDRGGFMGAIVVHHQMHIQCRGNIGLYGTQEFEKFAAAMTPVHFADYLTGSNVECSNQSGGAMAHVVVGAPFGDPWGEWQIRLGAIEGLNLALLVCAQH